MRRGEVWIAYLNPNCGAEVGKVRPVVVLQETALIEAGWETIIVLPLSTRAHPAAGTLRLHIPARGDLRQDCFILVDQPRTLDRRLFGDKPLTMLTADELGLLERSLRAVLGLHP